MTKIYKKQNIVKTIFASVLCVLFFSACKLGLGEVVDILPPEVAVTYPSPSEKVIIRDSFVMEGTTSDDLFVKSVMVSFLGKENGIQYKHGPFPAIVDNNSKTWKIEGINTAVNGDYPIKDALYTVSVSAIDNIGRETIVTVDYEIDNTAPVVVMQNPSTSDEDFPEQYGVELTLLSTAADDNIDSVTFNAFNKTANGYELKGSRIVTDLSGNQSINVQLGEFGSASVYDNFYNELYGNTVTNEKTFFYTIHAKDSAKTYKGKGINSSDDGNLSTEYYLFDEISSTVSAENLYAIRTSSYIHNTDATINEAKKAEAEAIINDLEGLAYPRSAKAADENSARTSESSSETELNGDDLLGVFSLYPSPNPTYKLAGSEAVESFDSGKFTPTNSVNATANLVVEMSPNRDSVPLDTGKISIIALKVKSSYKGNIPSEDTDAYEAAYRMYPIADSEGNAVYTLEADGSNYILTLEQKGVQYASVEDTLKLSASEKPASDGTVINLLDGSYVIKVVGEDKTGNAYSDTSLYGFSQIASNTPPMVSFVAINGNADPETSDKSFVKKLGLDETISIEGLVESFTSNSTNTIKEITYLIEGKKDDDSSFSYGETLVSTDKEYTIDESLLGLNVIGSLKGNKNVYRWNFTLTDADLQNPTKSKTFTINVTAKDANDRISQVARYWIQYDAEAPNFDASDILYEITDNFSLSKPKNKTITISGTSTDDDTVFAGVYNVFLDGETEPKLSGDLTRAETENEEGSTAGNFNFTFETAIFNTLDGSLPTDKSVKVAITVKDRVGNIKESEIYIEGGKPTISENEDETKVTDPVNPDFIDTTDAENPINWYKTDLLKVQVKASDTTTPNAEPSGINTVEWTIDSGANWTSLQQSEEKDTYTGSIVFPVSGAYNIQFRAIDMNGNDSDLKTLPVSIDFDEPLATDLDYTVDGENNASDNYVVNVRNVNVTLEGITDELDNLESITLKSIGSTNFPILAATDGTEKDVKFTIPENFTSEDVVSLIIPESHIKAAKHTSGGVTFTIKDKVGNTKDVTPFTLTIDSSVPTVAITEPSADIEVNGKVTIRGTAVEDRKIASIVIERKNGSEFTKIPDADVGSLSVWNYTLNTSDEAEGSVITLRARVTDTAGNTNISNELTLTVKKDSDRPIITVTDLNLSGMTSSTSVLLETLLLSGTVTDDDGVQNLYIATTETNVAPADSEYDEVSLSNGENWSYNFVDDGAIWVWFKVVDIAKGTFVSLPLGTVQDANLNASPKLTDETKNEFGYTNSSKKGSSLHLTIDTNAPELGNTILMDFYTVDESDNETLLQGNVHFSDNMSLGGDRARFKLKMTATDTNGIASVTVTHGSTVYTADRVGETNEYVTPLINTSDPAEFTDGDATFMVTATDKAGSKTTRDLRIKVDNTGPSVHFTTPEKGYTVKSSISVSGTARDTAGLRSIEYAIPSLDKADGTGKSVFEGGLKEIEWKVLATGTQSWKVDFNGLDHPELKTFLESVTIADAYDGGVYGIGPRDGHTWQVPIVFRLTDALGNVYISAKNGNDVDTGAEDYYFLNVNPNGDIPTVSVTYPSSEGEGTFSTLGGAIRIFGSAEDNERVEKVYVQIDTTLNNSDEADWSLSQDDEDFFTNNGYTVYKDSDWWGLQATGTRSWNITINENGEFNPEGEDAESTKLQFRVRSIDADGAVSEWSNPIGILVDNRVPLIGQRTSLSLVQYNNDGSVKTELPYTENMWVKGDWFLIGSIDDSIGSTSVDGITGIYVKGDKDGDITSDWFTQKEPGSSKAYNMEIPIDGGNEIQFTITAEKKLDSGESITSEVDIIINRDSESPTITASLTSNGSVITTTTTNIEGQSPTTTIQQSDGKFDFGSEVREDGSGLSRIAFWFERTLYDEATSTNKTYVYDITRESDNRTEVTDSVSIVEGDLPRLLIDGVERPSTNELTHSSISANKNIRVGTLVRIGGLDRLITDVNGNTVTFEPSVAESHTKAEFALAMIIDNTIIETLNSNGGIDNDDGDNFAETLERNNNDYTWTATIDSRRIPDGAITIKYIAYDESGNATDEQVVESKIENSPPRIAGITLGTDLNANGSTTDSGERVTYSTLVNNEAQKLVNLNVSGAEFEGVDSRTEFIAKGVTHIIPEIVGGNNELYYLLQGESVVDVDLSNRVLRDSKGDEHPMILYTTDPSKGGVPLGEDTISKKTIDPNKYNFTIWDSTEGTAVGVDSQSAELNLTMHVDAIDDIAPTSLISDLDWTSETENSLYENNRANGHIELGKRNVTNPKVSGTITIRGTAYDDKALGEIWASIDDFAFNNAEGMVKLASYASGLWTITEGSLQNYGWEFEIESETLDQTGHTVQWMLHWDSQKLSTVVGTNKVITVLTKDVNSFSSTAPEDIVADKNNPTYQIDVVPYITSVSTELSRKDTSNEAIFGRTALGRYPVYSGETGVVLNGFNLTGATATGLDKDGSAKTLTKDTSDDAKNSVNELTVIIPNTLVSGNIEVKVGSISALNNLNDNEAGSNKIIDVPNNDTLTDDIYFDVWGNTIVATPNGANILYPEMKVNLKTGELGYAFANGQTRFNMPTSSSSTTVFESGQGPYFESALAYDTAGIAYGISANQDVGTDTGSYVKLYYGASSKRILMATGVGSDIKESRVYSPVIAVTKSGSAATKVYIAYYDIITGQIRFQHTGQFATDFSGSTFKPPDIGFDKYSVIAGDVLPGDTTEAVLDADGNLTYKDGKLILKEKEGAGDYLSLDAKLTSGPDGKDLVVVTWYNSSAQELWYAYATDPNTDNPNWQKRKIDSNAGSFNAVKIDTDGGIHIAYTDTANSDLKYVKLFDDSDTPKHYALSQEKIDNLPKITVDGYSLTGTQIRLDVAKSGGNQVPYISYYSAGAGRAKIAYQVYFPEDDATDKDTNGSIDEVFTGKWEVSSVPTAKELLAVDINAVSVAVNKDGNGNLAVINGTNGTTNPAVAYVNSDGHLEMSQKKDVLPATP